MLIIYCLHGDELETEIIAKKMREKCGIDIYVGNPLARKKKVRFVERDINRSFGTRGTLEARRASRVKIDLLKRKDDLIIDLHRTTAQMPPCAIITNLEQLKLVSLTNITKVVYMTSEFSSGYSLIEHIPNSFSLEFYPDEKSIREVEKAIELGNKGKVRNKRFEVYKLVEIVKGDRDLKIKNFRRSRNGTYPVFSGELAYKGIKFLNTIREVVNIS